MQIHHTPTLHHQKRVAELCRRISDELGTNNGKTTLLVAAAVIHDTGKLLIPTNLLDQRQDLSPSEIRIIKEGHLLFGFHLLRLFGYSEEVTELVGHHHAMNGNNPEGLINRPISTEGQILIAADHFDALTNGRGYRDGNFSTKKVAIEEISRLPIEREIIDALESLAVPSASAGRTRTR
ncbi:MAG: HD domain-containing phosphohydrolase [Candidatus Margulisiibacteriota bacterium]